MTHTPVGSSHQPSMTEWFAAIGDEASSAAFREEDNRKVDRLEILFQEIGLPYERPEKFEARALFDRTPAFAQLLAEKGEELCAIRLVPKNPELPKIRQRGVPLRQCYEQWLLKQDVNPDDYIAYVCPHSETLLWSLTFVVTPTLIFGEACAGLHTQLTHGETRGDLYHFSYDFSQWQWSAQNDELKKYLAEILARLHVPFFEKQQHLAQDVQAQFSHDYVQGYFEATVWPNKKFYIIDYNRMLSERVAPPVKTAHGVIAYSGTVTGRAVIVTPENLASVDFRDGDILLCDVTDVRFLPLMRRAAAIVTDRGGILSHAAIIARELKKPCIVGTKNMTRQFYTGDHICVDTHTGLVNRITVSAPV